MVARHRRRGPGRHGGQRARQSPHPGRAHRPRRLHRARGRPRPPGPRRRRAGHGQDRGAPLRADRTVVVDGAEPGAAGRRGGARRRDPDGGHDPRLRRAGRLRRRRRAATSWASAPAAWSPASWVPSRSTPARRAPGPSPRRAAGPRRAPSGPPRSIVLLIPFAGVLKDVPLATLAAILIFVALRLFNVRRPARHRPLQPLRVRAGRGDAAHRGAGRRGAGHRRRRRPRHPRPHPPERPPAAARARAHPRHHQLATARARPDAPSRCRASWCALFATPIWYANAIHFRDEVSDALRQRPDRCGCSCSTPSACRTSTSPGRGP